VGDALGRLQGLLTELTATCRENDVALANALDSFA
jgi:hypothetical protein